MFADGDEVGVDAVDGQVERRRRTRTAQPKPADLHKFAIGGSHQVAGIKSLRFLPFAVGGVPEGVILGGGDEVAVYL